MTDHSGGTHTPCRAYGPFTRIATYTAVPSGVEGYFKVIAGQNVLEACGKRLSSEGWV